MPRRVSLPGADELFRTTGGTALQPSSPRQHPNGEAPGTAPRVPAPAGEQDPAGKAGPSASKAPGAPSGSSTRSGTSTPASGKETPARAPVDGSSAEHSGRGSGDEKQGDVRTPQQAAARPQSRPAQEGPAAPRSAPGTNPAQQNVGAQGRRRSRSSASRRPSGRERHDEKITVYVSAEELMDLEHARLVLRGEHGLAVDRGRIVREAVAVVLADLESRGDASILVRRLRGR
ncbi:hypothetical protein [Streptomyces sp. NPDC048639]|uniref:hypothetical protein n=1 Tax=Streptomyces sp. NPDC048639 TaxID=3365581 RepID=UPI003719A58E